MCTTHTAAEGAANNIFFSVIINIQYPFLRILLPLPLSIPARLRNRFDCLSCRVYYLTLPCGRSSSSSATTPDGIVREKYKIWILYLEKLKWVKKGSRIDFGLRSARLRRSKRWLSSAVEITLKLLLRCKRKLAVAAYRDFFCHIEEDDWPSST